VVAAFVVVAVACEPAQGAGDIVRDVATEGFSAMMSFLATGTKRLKKAGDAIQGRLYAKRRMISVIGT